MVRWRSIIEPRRRRLLPALKGAPPPGKLTLSSFEAFLYRTLSLSLAGILHLLLAALLMFTFSEIPVEEDRPIQVRLVPGRGGGDETKPADLQPPGDAGQSAKADPDPPKSELPKPEPPPEPKEDKPVRAAENQAPAGPVVEEPSAAPEPGPGKGGALIGPAVVGAGGSSGGSSGGTTVTEKEIERDPTEALRKRRAGTLSMLRGGSDRAILVVSGCYDRVQEVLDRLDVPHRVIAPEQLPRQDLSRCKAVLINCHNSYGSGVMLKDVDRGALEKEIVALQSKTTELRRRIDRTTEKMMLYKLKVDLLRASEDLEDARARYASTESQSDLVKNVREFVAAGGYVFTSDWGITILERAFPGTVKIGGVVGPRTVSIRAKGGAENHPLLEEVFLTPSKGSTTSYRKYDWDVDSSSYSIRVEKPVVEVLVESADLGRFPAVAVTFRHEKGRVLHVLSHFQKQATKQGDYALQNMLVNFLVEHADVGFTPRETAEPTPVPAPALPTPLVPTTFRVVKDDARGLSLPLPEGWTAQPGAEAETSMTLGREGSIGGGSLQVGPPNLSLSSGAGKWDDALRKARERLAHEMEIPEVTRKTQAFCCGSPAMMVCMNYTEGGRRWSALQFLVATPKALYTLSWRVPAEGFKALEAVLDKASRGLTIPK